MSDFSFTPAVRRNTPVILVAAGSSGSGKTWSLLELAMGLASDDKVALIDTEGNRSLLYADYFKFDHCELRPPYSPSRFLQALKIASQRGYRVIIVDSFSDIYVGEGGMVDMAAAELERVKNSAAAWAKPKAENKLVVRWFRQARCHVLLALRAEEKVRLEKVMRGGREQTVVVPIGWQMISEKNLPYEATMSLMLHPEQPGVPHPVKLPEQFRQFFPLNKPINRNTGLKLAEWCAGGKPLPEPGPTPGEEGMLPDDPPDDFMPGPSDRELELAADPHMPPF